jgi:hypothetical protein
MGTPGGPPPSGGPYGPPGAGPPPPPGPGQPQPQPAPPPPQYPPLEPQYGQYGGQYAPQGGAVAAGGGGPGFQDRAAHAVDVVSRHIRTPETKEFFKTSEFFVWLVTLIGVLIAAAVADGFDATLAWTLVTALSFAYIISRGISKAGARRGSDDGGRRGY